MGLLFLGADLGVLLLVYRSPVVSDSRAGNSESNGCAASCAASGVRWRVSAPRLAAVTLRAVRRVVFTVN